MAAVAQELRNSVLQAALQGKLTSQSEQETVNDLSINGSFKEDFDEELLPLVIPSNWKWVHLNEIAQTTLGKTLNGAKDEGDNVPYLCSINIGWNNISLDKLKNARFSDNDKEKYLLKSGDLLVCEGGETGRASIWESDCEMYYQNALHRVCFVTGCNPWFFLHVFSLYKSSGIIDKFSKGQTIKHLVQSALCAIPFPLPPLAEQQRIVEKIDELMAKIDEYEVIEKKLEALKKAFPQEMKDSLLQAAIQGKLVKQRPEEGTAEELYKQIQAEKQQLIKEGKIKKEKPLPEITEDEKPFDIPESWIYTRLNDLCTICTGKRDANFGSENGQYLFFTCAKEPLCSDTFSFSGEALLLAGNGDISNISHYTGEFEAYQRTYVLQPFCDSISFSYLYYHLNSNWVAYNNDKMFGTAIPYIRLGNLTNYVVAIPPLAEQKRIVAKLEEILPLCDELAELE